MRKATPQRFSAWYVTIAGLFITCLIVANIVAVKPLHLPFDLATPAGILIFPLSYLFGDVLTEVYGYALARRVIWLGFACNVLAVGAIWVAGALPGAAFAGWSAAQQASYSAILGITPVLLVASFCAYLAGEFLNSFVLAKLKVATKGRWLWTRTIGSTLVGEGVDSLIFISIVFGVALHAPARAVVTLILTQWALKVLYEVIATPFTYAIIGYLKRQEGLDPFDIDTNFSPVIFTRARERASVS